MAHMQGPQRAFGLRYTPLSLATSLTNHLLSKICLVQFKPWTKIVAPTIFIFLSTHAKYHIAQNFDRVNIDEFDEFPAIHQYFPYQNFPFS